MPGQKLQYHIFINLRLFSGGFFGEGTVGLAKDVLGCVFCGVKINEFSPDLMKLVTY